MSNLQTQHIIPIYKHSTTKLFVHCQTQQHYVL